MAQETVSNIDAETTRTDRAEQKVREQRVQRAKDEKNKQHWWDKILPGSSKEDDENDNKQRFLTENLPTYHTPSFTNHNGKWMALVQLYNRRGANREMYYDEILDMIPVDSLDGVEMNLIVTETSIKGDEKKKIIRKNARSGKGVISSSAVNGAKEDRENRSTQIGEIADLEDFDEYEEMLDSAHPIIVYKITLQVIGPDQQTVEDQIEDLNTLLDQRHEGARWGSLGGDQAQRFTQLFQPLPKDRFQMTSTASNYAGINFSVNAGLNDRAGLPIGRDALSLSGSTSFFDMDGSLKRQAIIAIPRSAVSYDYMKPEEEFSPPVSSIVAQYAANHAVMNGKRAHHIVLNDFNYMEADRYYRPWIDGAMQKYDVSNVTINPLQGFGDREDTVAIYSRILKKIVNIFHVLTNLELSEHQRAIILEATSNFFYRLSLYDEQNPFRSRLTNVTHPETYPTMGEMINEFTTDARRALDNNQELRSQDIETMESILRQELQANRAILGETTKITPATAKQVYYDFSRIESTSIKQVQFLNLIDYVIWTAKKGDIIIIHGVDRLWMPVWEMVTETITHSMNKGMRFLYTFDTITGDTRDRKKQADFFDMQEKYYKDLDTDVDYSIVGKCLPDEVEKFETALASELSPTIRTQLQAKSASQALVHRNVGDVNNFVHLQVVI